MEEAVLGASRDICSTRLALENKDNNLVAVMAMMMVAVEMMVMINGCGYDGDDDDGCRDDL